MYLFQHTSSNHMISKRLHSPILIQTLCFGIDTMGKSHCTYYEYATKNQNLIQLVRVGAKQVDNRPWQNIYPPPLKFELFFTWRGREFCCKTSAKHGMESVAFINICNKTRLISAENFSCLEKFLIILNQIF